MLSFPRVLKFSPHYVIISLLPCVVQPWQLVTDHRRPRFADGLPYRKERHGEERSDAATKRSAVVPVLTCPGRPPTLPACQHKTVSLTEPARSFPLRWVATLRTANNPTHRKIRTRYRVLSLVRHSNICETKSAEITPMIIITRFEGKGR